MPVMVAPGELVGRYRIRHRIGAGAFATVWLGYDEDLEVAVAVKVLADNWAGEADVRERFLAEAGFMRRISDERVIRVYDIGTLPDGRPYFVMDLANGGSLAARVANGCNPQEAVLLGAEAARAVQVLHDYGVLHRDVTPGNLLVQHEPDGSQRVVITDLGMAKEIAESSGLTLAAGTPAYMAPEQANGLGGFDARADVYALAAVVYALLTGEPPFTGSTLQAVLSRAETVRPARLADRLGTPPALDDLLRRSLAFEPVDRPATAAAFAIELDAIADRWAGRSGAGRERTGTAASAVDDGHPDSDRGSPATVPVEVVGARPSPPPPPKAEITRPLPVTATPAAATSVAGTPPAATRVPAEPEPGRPAQRAATRSVPPARSARSSVGFWLLVLTVFVVVGVLTWVVLTAT